MRPPVATVEAPWVPSRVSAARFGSKARRYPTGGVSILHGSHPRDVLGNPLRMRDRSVEQVNSYSGPPMTLGNAAEARVRLIVWCRDCGHQVEPDPIEQAQRYGEQTPVPKWRERLVCSGCGSRAVDMVVTGTEQRAKI